MNDRAGRGAWLNRVVGAGLPAVSAAQAATVRVDRAVAELRHGRPLALRAEPAGDPVTGERWMLVSAVETLGEARWNALAEAGPAPHLLLSAERLRAMGWSHATAPALLALAGPATLAQLQALAAVEPGGGDRSLLHPSDPASGSMVTTWAPALALCKRARLVPALVVLDLPAEHALALDDAQVLRFDPADLALAAAPRAGALRRVSDARVPVAAHDDCTLVLFREVDGDAEHLAIIVGRPVAGEPVPVRLHSACLTGDLLGSLRCDCGPQLQRAVERLAETGGVLLYLAQEGRGTGLANKLRAYRLQDAGLDTLQADRHLGFRDDERDFQPAAAMLHALGYRQIRLLTNNPRKIDALRLAGIDVVDRLALHGPVNRHNARYVQTKRAAGHLGSED